MPNIMQEQYSELYKNLNNIKHIDKPIPKAIFNVLKDKCLKKELLEICEATQLKLVFNCPESIKFLINPTDKVLKMAFSKNISLALEYDNISLELQEYLISKDVRYCRYIKRLDDNLQLKIIDKDVKYMLYINNPNLTIQELVIEQDITLFITIDNPDISIVKKFVESDFFKDNQEYVVVNLLLAEHNKELSTTAIQMIYQSVDSSLKHKVRKHKNYRSLASYVLDFLDEQN